MDDELRQQKEVEAEDAHHEALRRAGIPTPRTDAVPRRGPFHHYIVDDVIAHAKELERDLADAKAQTITHDQAWKLVEHALRSQSDPGAYTRRLDGNGGRELGAQAGYEPLHQWQRRALELVMSRMELGQQIPELSQPLLDPIPVDAAKVAAEQLPPPQRSECQPVMHPLTQADSPAPETTTGTWFQSAASGLWYLNAKAAGGVSRVRIDGQDYVKNGARAPATQTATANWWPRQAREGASGQCGASRRGSTSACRGFPMIGRSAGSPTRVRPWSSRTGRGIASAGMPSMCG